MIEMLIVTTLAGACIPLGGILVLNSARRDRWLGAELRHAIVAFGGGVLVAAVALVLVPEGLSNVGNPTAAGAFFVAGGVLTFLLERRMGQRRLESPQVVAMLLDYAPESIAIGAMFAVGADSAMLLGLLIGLQNLPEGFNSRCELEDQGHQVDRILLVMSLMALLGPLMGLLGWHFFSDEHGLLGALMLMSAGGILYLVFQDIAPQSRLDRHWAPPLGAILGFGLAMFGQALV